MGLLDFLKSCNKNQLSVLEKINEINAEIERNNTEVQSKIANKRTELVAKRETILSDMPRSQRKKVIFHNNFFIVGTRYECHKNPKKKRSDIIKKTKLNSPVHIERYFYQGEPAYMIVNTKYNLDLGVLSAGAANWLSDYFSKGITEVKLTNKSDGSFHVNVVVYEK